MCLIGRNTGQLTAVIAPLDRESVTAVNAAIEATGHDLAAVVNDAMRLYGKVLDRALAGGGGVLVDGLAGRMLVLVRTGDRR